MGSLLRDPRFLLLIGLFGLVTCACSGLFVASGDQLGRMLAEDAAEHPTESLDQVAQLARAFGVDLGPDLAALQILTTDLDEIRAMLDDAQADGEVTPDEQAEIQARVDEITRRLEAVEPPTGPRPTPPRPGAPRVEKISFHPEPEPGWTPPAWLVAGGIGGSILLLGVAAAVLSLLRAGDDDDEPPPPVDPDGR